MSRSFLHWNETFGKAKTLEYPEQLRQTAFRLSFIADISLPGILASDQDSQLQSNSFQFADTPSDLEENEGPVPRHSSVVKVSDSRNGVLAKAGPTAASSKSPSDVQMERHARRAQRSSTKTPPRPRHDDSQIQFAEIDSSPPKLVRMESPLLTANQKEVRERQQADTALFPDIRTSPMPNATEKLTDRPEPQLPEAINTRTVIGSTGPVHLPDPATTEAAPSSSPTPCAARTARREERQEAVPALSEASADEIPYSPPVPLPRKRYLSRRGKTVDQRQKAQSSPLKQSHAVEKLREGEEQIAASDPSNNKIEVDEHTHSKHSRKRS